TGMVAAIAMLFRGQEGGAVEDRLDILAGKKAAPREQASVSKDVLLKEGLQGLAGLAGKIFERFDNLRLLFIQADSPMKPEVFFIISSVAAAVGVLIAFVSR